MQWFKCISLVMQLHQFFGMETRELYNLLESAGDAAFVVEPHGRVCYWSRKAEQLLGITEEQALSKNCDQVLRGQDEAGCTVCSRDCHVLQLARKRGTVPSYDLHATTAWGERKWLNISIIVAHFKRGPSPLVVHLMRDIDQRKHVETVAREILVRVADLSGQQVERAQPGGPQQPPVDLTPRELSILRSLSLGQSTAEIAEELHISTTTVRNHIQHTLVKLRCHTRLEAVVRAARLGLI